MGVNDVLLLTGTAPTKPAPSRPTKVQILDVRACFISMRDSLGRVMLSWFWPALPPEEQADWVACWREYGLTHVVLCPVMQYPRNALGPNGSDLALDWRTSPTTFAVAVGRIRDAGFIPIIQMTSGDGGTGQDVDLYWHDLLEALAPQLPYCLLSCGFEVVGPGGGWSSAELSRGLLVLRDAHPGAIGVHLQPERATGASHPVEPDDPWQGDEAGFWWSHGGEYADVLLYQTPHDAKLLDPNGAGPDVGAWEDRWVEIVERLGTGDKGWRKIALCFFEVCGYNYFRGSASEADRDRIATRGGDLCTARGVACSFGDGLPGVQ